MTTLALFAREPSIEVDSSDAQCTPRDLAYELGEFDCDPCSNPRSHIRARITYSLEAGQDGLALPWIGSVFCNGRYSDPLPWCQRLRRHDGPWCALWKLDTTTKWFAELLAPGPRGTVATWAPFRERLTFERPGNCGTANFCSVLMWRDWEPPDAVKARLWL